MAYKLIVAESSPSIQKAIQLAFQDTEFEIYSYEDGHEAVKSITQIGPDAVIMSLSLPQKDGYEAGFFLRSQEELKQTILILLKGAFEPVEKEKIAGLNYDKIIQEPLDSEELVQTVRDLIEGKEAPQTLPEEPALDEIPVTETEHNSREKDSQIEIPSQNIEISGGKSLSTLPPEWEAKIKEIVRDLMKEEILDVERELEKRIKARVLADMKK